MNDGQITFPWHSCHELTSTQLHIDHNFNSPLNHILSTYFISYSLNDREKNHELNKKKMKAVH